MLENRTIQRLGLLSLQALFTDIRPMANVNIFIEYWQLSNCIGFSKPMALNNKVTFILQN